MTAQLVLSLAQNSTALTDAATYRVGQGHPDVLIRSEDNQYVPKYEIRPNTSTSYEIRA